MLYIIGTPIGNLKDISPRAIEAIASADIIIMESPLDSSKLLRAFNVPKKRTIKFNDQNAKRMLRPTIEEIVDKQAVYITSAGMPTISDPGAMLVKAAREEGIGISVIPGPSAAITAFAGSGILSTEFTFIGFLSRKQSHIEKICKTHEERESVVITYESPFRIMKTMEIVEKNVPHAHVCVAKELTKMFEAYFFGTPAEIIKKLAENPKNTKGEFVVIIDFRKKGEH